jgi:hypothetical protein
MVDELLKRQALPKLNLNMTEQQLGRGLTAEIGLPRSGWNLWQKDFLFLAQS